MDPRLAWAGDPHERPRFSHPDLYERICDVTKEFPIEYFQGMLYTEIVTTMERGDYGEWAVGGDMTRDGEPRLFTVQTGTWFAKVLSAEEAAERGLGDGGMKRSLRTVWKLPVRQIVTLEDAQVGVVTDQDGSPTLTGVIHCAKQGTPTAVIFLGLVLQLPTPGEDATREILQPIYSNDLSSGNIGVNLPTDPDSGLSFGGRFYLQAFLAEPDARFYRISNELMWMPSVE
jgi:hypothetical protein